MSCLLMGGQACVLYGGAEFSRDTDLAILADDANLERLQRALDDLQAECIAVPPFERRYLDRGLAVHFRCQHPKADRLRLDVMSTMRGVDPFPALWDRRTTFEFGDERIDVMSLPDLVLAKKTRRDKDWPMITRLLEANYFTNRESPSPAQIAFWLRELRTPALLVEVAAAHPGEAAHTVADRPLVATALAGDTAQLAPALRAEEAHERAEDDVYWAPLMGLLEELRSERRGSKP